MSVSVSLWLVVVGGAVGFLAGVIVGFRWVIWAIREGRKDKEIIENELRDNEMGQGDDDGVNAGQGTIRDL